jgi:hypothetical protein
MNPECSASCCPCLLLNAPELLDLRRKTGSLPHLAQRCWATVSGDRCDGTRRGLLGYENGFEVSTNVESVAVSEIDDGVSDRAGHTGQLRTTYCRM